MSILKPAVNQTSRAKIGIYGNAGSGKTRTSVELAIGLSQKLGSKKPVAFFDTETGSDFMIPLFKKAGIELLVAKSRAFADLITFCDEAEEACDVAIVDSVTHVWQELLNAWKQRLRRNFGFEIADWGKIKPEWQKFSDRFVNNGLHMIVCGRAGDVYEQEYDEDKKKMVMVKGGTKMKTEGEMAYEPSLLFEMERVSRALAKGDATLTGWINRAIVMKDRSDQLMGAEIDFPTFESFQPFWDSLNLGAKHIGVDTSRSSVDSLESPDNRIHRRRQVEITLELIKDSMVEGNIAGTGKVEKSEQVKHLKMAFGTSAWTAIEDMKLEVLQAGLAAIRKNLLLEPLGQPNSEVPHAPLTEAPKALEPEDDGLGSLGQKEPVEAGAPA